MTQEPQMNTSTPGSGDAPWFVRHFAITLYTWFFFGMALCGLLVPPERVAVLESAVITQGWHLSTLAVLLVSPVLFLYRRGLQDSELM